jgi:hypothetical protein
MFFRRPQTNVDMAIRAGRVVPDVPETTLVLDDGHGQGADLRRVGRKRVDAILEGVHEASRCVVVLLGPLEVATFEEQTDKVKEHLEEVSASTDVVRRRAQHLVEESRRRGEVAERGVKVGHLARHQGGLALGESKDSRADEVIRTGVKSLGCVLELGPSKIDAQLKGCGEILQQVGEVAVQQLLEEDRAEHDELAREYQGVGHVCAQPTRQGG